MEKIEAELEVRVTAIFPYRDSVFYQNSNSVKDLGALVKIVDNKYFYNQYSLSKLVCSHVSGKRKGFEIKVECEEAELGISSFFNLASSQSSFKKSK